MNTPALSHRHVLPRPGPVWGDYPLRPRSHALGTGAAISAGLRWRLPALARRCAQWQAHFGALDDVALAQSLVDLSQRLRREGLAADALAAAIGMAGLAAQRNLGWTPRDNQFRAAAAMALGGLAEMATGEGKTLAIALAAAAGALAGVPVHVVTANDYLAARDAAKVAPLFTTLALSVRDLTGAAVDDSAARRAAWAADVVYTTASDLAFDYLRDGLPGAREAGARLRGLCMVLVDEADSVLLDEADMPLILARAAPHRARRAFLWQALAIARQMQLGVDLHLSDDAHVALTPDGEQRIESLTRSFGGPWRRPRYRREAVLLALQALHVQQRDEHYVVRDGAVELLDGVTGRVASGRVWSRGLHTLVALKESASPPPEQETVTQITFQRFFQRYWRMGGISGTLGEARSELAATYGLPVVRIASHRRSRAVRCMPRYFDHWEQLAAALPARVATLQAAGRPVLVGTDSIMASQQVAQALQAAGVAHVLLNALNDIEEAAIVARAGESGRVTVATRVAGRGTDIALDAAARRAGGLHVLSCQRNPSRRLDRQLTGRAARGGDPGSHESWLWAAHPGFDVVQGAETCRTADIDVKPTQKQDDKQKSWTQRPFPTSARALSRHLAHRAEQALEERRRAAVRRDLLRQDVAWEERLVFSSSPSSS